MIQFLKVVLFLASLVILTCALTALYVAREYVSSGSGPEKIVLVPKGSGIMNIAYTLSEEGAISDARVFIAAAVMKGDHKKFKAGEYLIPANASMQTIMDKMVKGDIIRRHITFREGLTSFEMIEILNATPNMPDLVVDIPPEGSLLPETYDYEGGSTRQSIVARMTKAMEKTLADLWASKQPDLPLETPQQAIILASIVEKETGVASERKAVAGVFINRLRKGMPLQSDPTVIYAITQGKHENAGQGPIGRRLLRTDLEMDSPYNTYKNPGLPPGPIANPGKASIEATLNPEAHDYLYFVADGKGGHVFARTLEEHNSNVDKWRQFRKLSEQRAITQ